MTVSRSKLIKCGGDEADMHANYEVMRKLGQGGFGLVHLARSKVTGLLRAIKEIQVSSEDERYVVSRLAEIDALMTLDHPNVVKLFEYYGDARSALYLVEEPCTGGTLEDRIKRAGGSVAPDEAAVYLRQMLRGVLACHSVRHQQGLNHSLGTVLLRHVRSNRSWRQHGLAHRDLKPDNFAFATTHEDSVLKVLDFGLSLGTAHGLPLRAASDSAAVKDYLQAAGRPSLSAPETLPTRDRRGGKVVRAAVYGTAADVWALGAITFEMITGEPLVHFGSRPETNAFLRMMEAVMGHERDVLDDLAIKVRSQKFLQARLECVASKGDARVVDLLSKMLAIDPEERITCQQALKHPFIAESFFVRPECNPESQSAVATVVYSTILERMRRFADAPPLQKLAVLTAAHLLGPQDSPVLREHFVAFRLADRSGDGVLQPEELASALTARGVCVPSDLPALYRRCDLDESGGINLVEFVACTLDPAIYSEERMCKAIFGLLDADRDGRLTARDLEGLLGGDDGRSASADRRRERAAAIIASAATQRDAHSGEVYVGPERFVEVMREAGGQ